MRILHTSDWHLGHKLLGRDRSDEQEQALEWLLDTIRSEQVDLLVVAGDIFDVANPPNYARRLYYQFLRKLLSTGCRHVVIVGGNHDSPSMLDASGELLQLLNIHIIGALTADPRDQIIELSTANGTLEAVVAAVPFLRDRDLQYSVAAESIADRHQRLQDRIREHYDTLGQHVSAYTDRAVPIITTGHLFATGAQTAARQDNIYIGNQTNIDARHFPSVFDYVALGHIHRPQAVGGREWVRYSGSLLPLDFSETKDEKCVYIVDFEGNKLQTIRTVPVPTLRRLKSITGTLDKVQSSLQRFVDSPQERELPPWVEVVVETDRPLPRLDQQLREQLAGYDVDILAVRLQQQYQGLQTLQADLPDLGSLDVETVFRRRCEGGKEELPPEEWESLLATFRELRQWWDQRQEDATAGK